MPPNYAPTYAQDRAEIEDLTARYLFAMDWNDIDTYAETFAPDGVLDYANGSAQGRDAIRAMAREFKELIGRLYVDAEGKPAILRHMVAQKAIRVEGDRAWSTAFWYEMANDGPGGKPALGSFGTYEDELVRIDGRWRFARRRINNEFLKGRESPARNPVAIVDAKADAGANSQRS